MILRCVLYFRPPFGSVVERRHNCSVLFSSLYSDRFHLPDSNNPTEEANVLFSVGARGCQSHDADSAPGAEPGATRCFARYRWVPNGAQLVSNVSQS